MEDGGTVPEAAALPWCALVKPDPVVLPDDLSEAKLFAERALLGFVGLMDDLHPACMTDVAKQYGVADSGKSGCASAYMCMTVSSQLRLTVV